MGVPKFFRWISARYPCINCVVDPDNVPLIDHFYLDMNGILHTCSHPHDGANVAIPEEEIFNNIKTYTSFLIQLMKPRKTLFLAVDGVAPRAKMTQQRARRFQAAQEARLTKAKAEKKGHTLTGELFDPCVISPGTEFMERLHAFLIRFVEDQVQHDNTWRRIDVILSGHDCPGEGEQKIREYMSYKRTLPDYRANERYCIYGMDADLIFLGLTTHEINLCILRENVIKSANCKPEQMPFCITYLSVLREYIDCEFRALKDSLPFEYDLERILDDWIFMAFLLGNDFIPHIPNLHIHAESLLVLWDTYNVVLPQFDGYLIEYGRLNVRRFHRYIEELSKFEQSWFEEREADHRWMRGKRGARLAAELENLGNFTNPLPVPAYESSAWKSDLPLHTSSLFKENTNEDISDLANLVSMFSASNVHENDHYIVDELAELAAEGLSDSQPPAVEREMIEDEAGSEEEDVLVYKMHRRDYYRTKMGIEEALEGGLKHNLLPIITDYVRMLQWILNYYYLRVADWNFYYAYNYAPFARDLLLYTQTFLHINDVEDNTELTWAQFDDNTQPVLPFVQQLMILPADCAYIVPKVYRPLMTDSKSPLAPFFPEKFETDINGKIASWEAVVLIPFIDEHILLSEMSPLNGLLDKLEVQRNMHKSSRLYSAQTVRSSQSEIASPKKIEYDFFRRGVMFEKSDFEACYQNTNRRVDENFPSLLRIDFDTTVKKIPVHVFETPSKLDSLALVVKPPCNNESFVLEELANQLLGRPIRVRWPHCATVMPVRLMNSKEIWELGDFNHSPLPPATIDCPNKKPVAKLTRFLNKTAANDTGLSEVDWFYKRVDSLKNKLRTRRAILFPDEPSSNEDENVKSSISVLLFSRKLEGWSVDRRNNDSPEYPHFMLRPIFAHSSVPHGGQLQLTADQPFVSYRFATTPGPRRKKGDINQATMYVEPLHGSCSGLGLDLFELALPNSFIVPPFRNVSTLSEVQRNYPITLDALFHPGQIVLVQSPPHTGRVAQVTEIQEKYGKVLVQLYSDLSITLDLSPLIPLVKNNKNSCHLKIWDLANMVRLPKPIVVLLTGVMVFVRGKTDFDGGQHSTTNPPLDEPMDQSAAKGELRKSWQIGLRLRRNKTHDQVLGWSRYSFAVHTWFYSDKVTNLLITLKQKFPDFYQTLFRDRCAKNDIFYTQLPDDYLNAVVKFIDDSGCHSISLVLPSNAIRLEPDMITELRSIVNDAQQDPRLTICEEQPLIPFEPEVLLAPGNSQQNLIPLNSANFGWSQKFELLDRVYFCKSGNVIPLGLYGTIIGIIPDNDGFRLEVMFDKEFPGAIDLCGSGPCCASVRSSAVTSITSTRDVHISDSTIDILPTKAGPQMIYCENKSNETEPSLPSGLVQPEMDHDPTSLLNHSLTHKVQE